MTSNVTYVYTAPFGKFTITHPDEPVYRYLHDLLKAWSKKQV